MLVLVVLVHCCARACSAGVLPGSCLWWWCIAMLVLVVLVHCCAHACSAGALP